MQNWSGHVPEPCIECIAALRHFGLDLAAGGRIYAARHGTGPSVGAMGYLRYGIRSMNDIKVIPGHKRMDNIDAMLRGRFSQPSLRQLFYRQVIARRKRG